jgi:hypothetical protein
VLTFALLLLAESGGVLLGLFLVGTRWTIGGPFERSAIVGISLASGVGAALAPGAPTGWTPFDVLLRALLGAGVAAAASYLAPRPLLLAGVLAVVVSFGSGAEPAAAIVTGVTLVGVASRRWNPVAAALSGALLVQTALRLQQPRLNGVTSVEAFLIVMPVLVLGAPVLPAAVRRTVGRTLVAVTAVALVASGGAVIAALVARSSLQRGITVLRSAAQVGDTSATLASRADQFRVASSSFAQAGSVLDSWWARPSEAVPVVAQQMRALRTASQVGQQLSLAAGELTTRIDAADLRISGGQIQIAKIMALQPVVSSSLTSLDVAVRRVQAIRSPWLLAPLQSELDREGGRLSSTANSLHKVAQALPHLPDLLGANGERRYFLAVQTPSESRATGGLIGSWGEIIADNGQIHLTKFGNLTALDKATDPNSRRLVAPPDYVSRYGRFGPAQEWANVNLSPDFPTDADVMANLYPQSGGDTVDGVVAVDPAGLAAILAVVGPVAVPGWPVPITSSNAEQVLLYQQYATVTTSLEQAAPARINFLNTLAQAAWTRLTSGFAGSPQQLLEALATAADGKHLLVAATRPSEEALFEELGVSDAMTRSGGDFVGLITQNAGGDKLDWFLYRQLDYSVSYDPSSGQLEAQVTIKLRNTAPATGQSPYFIGSGVSPPLPRGANKLYLSLYTPWAMTSARLNGVRVNLDAQTELGLRVYSGGITIPAGGSVTLEVSLKGKLSGPQYRLEVFQQPMVHPDVVTASLHPPWGWHLAVDDSQLAGAHFDLTSNRTLVADLSDRRWLW